MDQSDVPYSQNNTTQTLNEILYRFEVQIVTYQLTNRDGPYFMRHLLRLETFKYTRIDNF